MMELLSPAGGLDSLIAAVQTGADAVYMGFGAFNARRSAKNFTDEEFASAVAYCHLRGVRLFLTLNTLLTDRELEQAAESLRKASDMGVDAVLVQDWGLLTLAREIVPDVPLHASTQMSCSPWAEPTRPPRWDWSGWCWPASWPAMRYVRSAPAVPPRSRFLPTAHCACATPVSAR